MSSSLMSPSSLFSPHISSTSTSTSTSTCTHFSHTTTLPPLPAFVPTSPQLAALQQVIKMNHKYQAFLQQQIIHIQNLLRSTTEKRRVVSQLISRTSTATSTSTSSTSTQPKRALISRKAIFAAPWFQDANGDEPPPNIDTLRKQHLRGNMPSHHRFIKWSHEERRNLELGVRYQNQAIEIAKIKMEYKDSKEPDAAAKMKAEIDRIQNLPDSELLLNTDGLDWDALASTYVPTRSGMDCRIQWLGNDDKRINQQPWSRDEDARLLSLAEAYHGHSWIDIARELDTNRTPMQCFQRYQRSLNSNLIRSKWKQEEDDTLARLVLRYGEKNWQHIAAKLKMRTDQQCLHRWAKSVDPSIRAGRWTPVEDMRLRLAVKAYGARNWNKIQKHIPGRTDVKCRERWVNVLNPQLTKQKWTEQEDQHLMALIEQLGLGAWTKIAKQLPPRTDNQCWRRWKKLSEKSTLDSYRQQLAIKRTNMVRNFVGRVKERPYLTVEDITDNKMNDTSQDQSQSLQQQTTQQQQQQTQTQTQQQQQQSRTPSVPLIQTQSQALQYYVISQPSSQQARLQSSTTVLGSQPIPSTTNTYDSDSHKRNAEIDDEGPQKRNKTQ